MKKNLVLYVLLIVLFIMNGFFLFNYLGRPQQKGPKESSNFIIKELKFNAKQLKEFESLEENHHAAMKNIGDDMRIYKDALFNKITAQNLEASSVDSLIAKISNKDELKEKELFKKLRGIYEICNEEQKKQFSKILKKARRFDGDRPDMPRRPLGPEGHERPNRPE